MAKQERTVLHPVKKADQCGAFEIKRIICGWSDAEYKTTLYLRLNGRGVARLTIHGAPCVWTILEAYKARGAQ